MRFFMPVALIASTVSVFAQEGGEAPGGGGLASWLPMMLVMFAIVYFLMIRPEQKKQKDRRAMMESIKKGDKVLSLAGIYGTVTNVKGSTIMVKIADNTTVEMTKAAVSSVVTKENSADQQKDSGEKK
jgi:preprotein translocase subunit YajC